MKQEQRRSMSQALRTIDLPVEAMLLIHEGKPGSSGTPRRGETSPAGATGIPTTGASQPDTNSVNKLA